jgi:hypothetical protein
MKMNQGKSRFPRIGPGQDSPTLPPQDKLQFEWWAQKKGADHGIDGKILLRDDPKAAIGILISLQLMLASVVSALSVARAIFLILELDQPFGGLIQISSEPMLNALSQLAK